METSKTRELTNFHYISLTDVGCRRENNEDYLGYFDTVNGHVFVVCDGCGGMPCGEKASQTVVNSLKFFFSNFYYKDPFQAMKDAFHYAKSRMEEEERNDSGCSGMATTVVLVLIRYNKVYYAHIGDSRLYLFSRRTLSQVTHDDSYVQMLVDRGKISEQEALTHPRRNELLRVMSASSSCEPNICAEPLEPSDGDLLLLCSDGLYNMVGEKDLKATLAHRGYIEDKGMELMEMSKKNGGFDNITLQLIKFFNVDIEKTDQRPIVVPKAVQGKAKWSVIIAAVVALVLTAALLLGIRIRKSQGADKDMESSVSIIRIDVDSTTNCDSIISLYGVDSESVRFVSRGGRSQICVPIKKVVVVRYFDNLQTLEMLYGTPADKIRKVNGLSNDILQPGSELIIP